MKTTIKLSKTQTKVIRRLQAKETLIRFFNGRRGRYLFVNDSKPTRITTLIKLEKLELIIMKECRFVELTEKGASILV